MRVKASSLRRIIQEELRRSLKERTFPDTLEIDPSGDTFSVEAEPDREGETGERRRIRGKIDKHKGRYLPKYLKGEDYFDPEHSSRQVSGMLSAQLRDVINQKMQELGFDASVIDVAQRGGTKGDVMGDALAQLLSLSDKLRSKRDKDILKAAIESILGIKMGFSVPDPFVSDEEL